MQKKKTTQIDPYALVHNMVRKQGGQSESVRVGSDPKQQQGSGGVGIGALD
jgi:hypothetical protein